MNRAEFIRVAHSRSQALLHHPVTDVLRRGKPRFWRLSANMFHDVHDIFMGRKRKYPLVTV